VRAGQRPDLHQDRLAERSCARILLRTPFPRSCSARPRRRFPPRHVGLGHANRIVVTATKEIRELALLGVPSSKVSVVPCGVDLEHITPSPKCFAIGTEAQLSLSATERWSAGAA
jgi:hypothetical protein